MKSGYIFNTNAVMLGSYMVLIAQHNKTENWTVKQLLDSVKAKMSQTDHETAIKNNWRKDSVFLRSPNGIRIFIGMGELSFEKMVAKATVNLPQNYNGDYNLKMDSGENITTAGLLISNSDYPALNGDVLLYKKRSW